MKARYFFIQLDYNCCIASFSRDAKAIPLSNIVDWIAEKKGTLKYQFLWFVYDQIIVSGSLLDASTGYYTKPDYATIIEYPFLLVNDEKYGGQKPKRTYFGYQYKGGFSDHLPVLLKLKKLD